MRHDMTKALAAVEERIPTLASPYHRAILETYRRHVLLELSGRMEEIMAPEIMVEHPIYHIRRGDGYETLDGREAVLGMYNSLGDVGANVAFMENLGVAVADGMLFTESLTNYYLPGYHAKSLGYEVDDVDAIYLEKRWGIIRWGFDEQARVSSEDIYRVKPHEFHKCTEEDSWRPEEVREFVAPMVDKYPFYQG
jgi:hypothetical protein